MSLHKAIEDNKKGLHPKRTDASPFYNFFLNWDGVLPVCSLNCRIK